MENDNICRPYHYSKNGMTPLEASMKGLFSKEEVKGFMAINICKYVCRHESKGGKEDLLKAKEYLDLLIDFTYGDD